MFTQCPECDTAFRVTAEVLKKAAGQVRCGGCGIAFNALEHLSEEMPQSALRAKPRDHVPELSPEIDDDHGQSVPRPISAKRSAALLKTLDELAGSNILFSKNPVIEGAKNLLQRYYILSPSVQFLQMSISFLFENSLDLNSW